MNEDCFYHRIRFFRQRCILLWIMILRLPLKILSQKTCLSFLLSKGYLFPVFCLYNRAARTIKENAENTDEWPCIHEMVIYNWLWYRHSHRNSMIIFTLVIFLQKSNRGYFFTGCEAVSTLPRSGLLRRECWAQTVKKTYSPFTSCWIVFTRLVKTNSK